ncbi:hypothetical protein JOM56_000799 [Amanita muscaria]
MKSFKVLVLLTLAVTLSCGFPTNVTQATDGSTDGFIKVIKRNAKASDLFINKYFDPIFNAASDASHYKNAELTKNLVAGLWNNNKNYNYIMSSPKLVTTLDGVKGVDWAQQWITGFDGVDYHLFIIGSGTFTRKGKGGYENWAWKGSVKQGQDLHSNVVTFVKPGSIGVVILNLVAIRQPNLG